MGRPKGAINRGLKYAISRTARELEMSSKVVDIGIDELSSAAAAYRRLLNRAIRCASPGDAATLQRIGAGLSALTKAISVVEKGKRDNKQTLHKSIVYPIE